MAADLMTAFILGLLGGSHCLFMCGGLMSALTLGQEFHNAFVRLLLANIGRISSYALMGFAVGLLMRPLSELSLLGPLLRSIGGLLLILMGLYISQWYTGLKNLEHLGAGIWRTIRSKVQFNTNHSLGVLGFGALWGWLPCGLVYSTLAWASTRSAISSEQNSPITIADVTTDASTCALLMFVFGLGTVPMVFATGQLAQTLSAFFKSNLNRQVIGGLIITFGSWTLIAPWLMIAHGH